MSIVSDLGNSVITAVTGQNPTELQAEVAAAQQQLQLAIATMIGLEVIIVVELLVLVAMGWKERH